MHPIHVTCAIIEHNSSVLAAQRSSSMHLPGKWEFPGGKQRPGEALDQCLVREILEELGLDIQVQVALQPVEHQYPDKHIVLYPFVCSISGGTLRPAEHQSVRFFAPDQLPALDWAAADIPVLEQWFKFRRDNGELPTLA